MELVQSYRHVRSIVCWKAPLRTGATMTRPHYINEVLSDVRGVKPGWYAMDDVGKLYSGPFSSHEECLTGAIHPAYERLRPPPQ
jgi:hypothetical protein